MSGYLIDTSVHLRYPRSAVLASAVDGRDPHRVRYRCAIVEMEVLRATATSVYRDMRAMFRAGHHDLEMTPEVHDRALDVQKELAATSRHAGIQLQDLLIAACAEINHVTVLHYDADFDTIADVSGQDTEWVVEKGSVP